MSGCWPNRLSPLVVSVSPWFAILVLLYVVCVVFAVIRVIAALFLKDTLQASAGDAEMLAQQKQSEKVAYAKKLKDLFIQADSAHKGFLTYDDLAEIIAEPLVKSYMSALELDVHEVWSLFSLLDDGDGRLSFEEFAQGVIRLKGTARSMDVIQMMKQMDNVARLCDQIARDMAAAREKELAITSKHVGNAAAQATKSADGASLVMTEM